MTDAIPYFDGHNDVLLRLYLDREGNPLDEFLAGTSFKVHIDLPRARQGHFVGGLFALFSPPAQKINFTARAGASLNIPLPPTLPPAEAWTSIMGEIAALLRLIERADGQIAFCHNVAEINQAIAAGQLAVVLHLEGADAIDEDLYLLDILYAAGLRSLGPVWSRANAFGTGVPLQFPGSPDQGPGLMSEAGKRLIRANAIARKILIDLSHMNEQGFWDIAKLSDAPLIATHSNVHAITPSPAQPDGKLAARRHSRQRRSRRPPLRDVIPP